MDIQITFQQQNHGLKGQKIRRKLRRVLKDLACHDKELSLLFADDVIISALNQRYRGRNGPTNVLAFPMTGGPPPDPQSNMLGDVVVSLDSALREAEELGETLEYTVDRLLVHGILHLLGYDHERSALGARQMENEEKRLMVLMREG